MTDNLPAVQGNRLEELAQAHEGEAFALLVETIRDPKAKLEHKLKAAERILDQARGKPKVAQPKDPTTRKQKAVHMSVDTLLKIVQGAQQRVAQQDRNKAQAQVLEGEFVPVTRKRPMNEYQLPSPVVPGTNDVEDLLS